jgi:hypothetical protein
MIRKMIFQNGGDFQNDGKVGTISGSFMSKTRFLDSLIVFQSSVYIFNFEFLVFRMLSSKFS